MFVHRLTFATMIVVGFFSSFGAMSVWWDFGAYSYKNGILVGRGESAEPTAIYRDPENCSLRSGVKIDAYDINVLNGDQLQFALYVAGVIFLFIVAFILVIKARR